MDLSSTYATLYNKRISSFLRYAFQFSYYVYRTGKVRELSSFLLWEVLYKIGFFTDVRTIQFSPQTPLSATDILSIANHDKKINIQFGKSILITSAPIDWRYCITDRNGILWGCEFKDSTALIKSVNGYNKTVVAQFNSPILSLYISNEEYVYVCSGGLIYRSSLAKINFLEVLKLNTKQSYFLFNRGMSELPDGTLLLGEYASIWKNKNWQNLAYLYIGNNSGQNWEVTDFLLKQGVNKHIHIVQYSKFLKRLFLTDGDNKKQIWSNSSNNYYTESANNREGWQLINKFHAQMGGYTSMADYRSGVLFGTDYLGGTNFFVHTSDGKKFKKFVIPDPYRRSPVINIVTRLSGDTFEIWALLHNSIISKAKCLLIYSNDDGLTWTKVIEYDGCDHEVQLLSSSTSYNQDIYFCIRQFRNNVESNQSYRIASASS